MGVMHNECSPSNNKRNEFVERLRGEESTSVNSILTANPFAPRTDPLEIISIADFCSHLFEAPSFFDALIEEIRAGFANPGIPLTVRIIHGYSGTGKTTFLHYYQEQPTEFENFLVDFDSQLTKREPRETPRDVQLELKARLKSGIDSFAQHAQLLTLLITTDPPIACVLRQELRGARLQQAFRDLIKKMVNQIEELRKYFVLDLVGLMSKMPSNPSSTHFDTFLTSMPPRNVLLIFLLTVVEATQDTPGARIFFDNLDRVELDYLSDEFHAHFAAALELAALICGKTELFKQKFNFYHRYKFIFCVREANYSAMDMQHKRDYRAKVGEIRFYHDFDSDFYSRVVKKRLQIAREVYCESPNSLKLIDSAEYFINTFWSISEDLFQAHDRSDSKLDTLGAVQGKVEKKYFINVIAPLFNFDLKKLLPMIVKTATQLQLGDLQPNNACKKARFEFLRSYGRGGTLMWAVCKELLEDDFTKNLFDDRRLEIVENSKGHCLKSRMILTVILNLSNYDHRKHVVERGGSCSLMSVVDTLAGIYSPYDILEKIQNLFLSHERDWVNLITIKGKSLSRRKGSFKKEIQLMKHPRSISDFESSNAQDRQAKIGRKARKALQEIKLSPAPAGFVFLKHALVHFEFYSSYRGNKRSLFSVGNERDQQGRFLFESIIKSVLRLVKTHVGNMSMFFQTRMKDNAGITPEYYITSNLCFRHVGKFHSEKSGSGYFHAFRLINSMISYVDHFREYLLSSEIPSEERHDINKILTEKLFEFADLLNNCEDPKSKYFFDRYKIIYDRIVSVDYRDFSKFEI